VRQGNEHNIPKECDSGKVTNGSIYS